MKKMTPTSVPRYLPGADPRRSLAITLILSLSRMLQKGKLRILRIPDHLPRRPNLKDPQMTSLWILSATPTTQTQTRKPFVLATLATILKNPHLALSPAVSLLQDLATHGTSHFMPVSVGKRGCE